MMQPPKTYYEWANVLGIVDAGSNDEEALEAMQHGSIELQAGVAERFITLLSETLTRRLNAAIERFQAEQRRFTGDQTTVRALLLLRKELSFLMKAASIPALREDIRTTMTGTIQGNADSIQQSLEDSAKKDRSGKMSSLVRNHKVNCLH